MDKIQLMVLGLTASTATNAYALILKEAEGERRLPIIIGAFEAQAIALEMEGVLPPRPMTHDLMKSLIDSFGGNLTEVFINDLTDSTFFAKLVFEEQGIELDARPSDAIALAVRCNAPIFVTNEILDETGVIPQNENEEGKNPDEEFQFLNQSKQTSSPINPAQPSKSKIEILHEQLDKAVKDEDYEKAASIRDDIKRLLESS